MKTISEKAQDYSVRDGNENADVKYSAYMEGANETIQTILDRFKTRSAFRMIRIDAFAIMINEMRNGTPDKIYQQ